MSSTPMIITLDGPAGSGKSTLARLLAKRLRLAFLDTGAMYRAVALAAMGRGISPEKQPDAVASLAAEIRLDFDFSQDPPLLLLGDVPVGDRIRDADVTAQTSVVAGILGVRAACVAAQQRIGKENPRLVTEGRDQGSVVFPAAAVKFWIEADALERARRRAAQLRAMGKEADEAAIFAAIHSRDHQDATREASPMVRPQGAVEVDTTHLTEAEALDLLVFYVRAGMRKVRQGRKGRP